MTGCPDWRMGVIGDAEIAERLSPVRQIGDMIRVEAAYARALGAAGEVASDLAEEAAGAIETARIDHAALADEAQVDGMPVPALSRQLKALTPEHLHPAVHRGLTSQDVMDSALMLALADITQIFDTRLGAILDRLQELRHLFGDARLMARTRMQAALPVTVGHRIKGWHDPLLRARARLQDMRPNLLVLQLGGPVGTRGGLGDRADAISKAMAAELDLGDLASAWHTDRTRLVELAGWLASVTGCLGKMGHDLALMAQQGVNEVTFARGGRSSAMAHKQNPVRAETLMALSRYVSVQLSAMNLALDHEQERSGASWTLEWLVLPQMLQSAGAGLLRAGGLLDDITTLGEAAPREPGG